MPDEGQPSGFLNRAIVVLFLVFSIPAALTVAGTYYVAIQGRVPGGSESFCETTINEELSIRIDIYSYTAGLVPFETQTFSVSDDGENWTELFADTMPHPQEASCEASISQLDENNILLYSQKTVAWSSDGGANWSVHNVCDSPQPSNGRCDTETLNYSDMDFNADGTGSLTVIESDVDDFGEPQRDEDSNPLIVEQWQLTTSNSGQNWSLVTLE